MNPDNTSLFDLSPPEKLQLVEDLWDDLAALPSAVPVHEWQKDELARRKANLMSRPASGLSWDEVKSRGGSTSTTRPSGTEESHGVVLR
ncbi:MAG: addiction module protein [Thermodesulfobacteriota bacterium]|nr:addiction module protein [Thermodesulfobacteriota bacterium]